MGMSEEDSNVTSLAYLKVEWTGQSCLREGLAVWVHITPKASSPSQAGCSVSPIIQKQVFKSW